MENESLTDQIQKNSRQIFSKNLSENLSSEVGEDLLSKTLHNTPHIDLSNSQEKRRSKTSLRQRYEAEAEVIRRKIGSLENVRSELGLSQRKMCELLMVDPSAWTRWIKNPKKVPPHIFRALQWYMALIEKQPEWHPQNSFSGAARILNDKQLFDLSERMKKEWQEEGLLARSWNALEEHKEEWRLEKLALEEKLEKKEQLTAGWKLLLLINTTLLAFLLVFML